jgi:CRP/FNR family cyclic AMP-dependent transcriptional regulator
MILYGQRDERSVNGVGEQQELVIRLIIDQQGRVVGAPQVAAALPALVVVERPLSSPDVAFKVRSFAPKETIYREGDSADSIMFIQTGTVKTFVLGLRKEQTAAHVYRKDDLFGELAISRNVRYDTAIAMETTEIREYFVPDIRNAISGNATAVSLVDRLVARVEGLYDEKSGAAAVHSLSRLIAELIEIGKRDGSPAPGGKVFVGPKYTHELLAAMIGARRETVTIHMQSLRDHGAVTVEKRVRNAVEKRDGGMTLDLAVLQKLLKSKERSKT